MEGSFTKNPKSSLTSNPPLLPGNPAGKSRASLREADPYLFDFLEQSRKNRKKFLLASQLCNLSHLSSLSYLSAFIRRSDLSGSFRGGPKEVGRPLAKIRLRIKRKPFALLSLLSFFLSLILSFFLYLNENTSQDLRTIFKIGWTRELQNKIVYKTGLKICELFSF